MIPTRGDPEHRPRGEPRVARRSALGSYFRAAAVLGGRERPAGEGCPSDGPVAIATGTRPGFGGRGRAAARRTFSGPAASGRRTVPSACGSARRPASLRRLAESGSRRARMPRSSGRLRRSVLASLGVRAALASSGDAIARAAAKRTRRGASDDQSIRSSSGGRAWRAGRGWPRVAARRRPRSRLSSPRLGARWSSSRYACCARRVSRVSRIPLAVIVPISSSSGPGFAGVVMPASRRIGHRA